MFYVVPAKGPVIYGHVLIVSKVHDVSLLCMEKSQKLAFVDIIEKIIGTPNFYTDFLFFEHGSYNDSKGGKTIDHTHVHLVPNFEKYANVIKNDYELKKEIDIEDIPNTKLRYPYLLMGTKKKVQIYDGNNVESQVIRIKIAEFNPMLIPYWQDDDNMEAVYKTIKMWEDVKF
jgi:diadenosine tetraphosphate (Ap4A) HIT family hydrolase